MNLEQAKMLQGQLVYLEGIVAWITREYIWKVLIGPEDPVRLKKFEQGIDPCVRLNEEALVKPYVDEELSVYFLLKKNGNLVCRNYESFLLANHIGMINADLQLLTYDKLKPS